MKKCLLALLFAFTVVGINCTDCELRGPVSSGEECWFRKLSGDQTHCCYVEEDTENPCWSLSDDEYENIKRFIDYSEHIWNDLTDISIDCSSNILSYSLFILPLLSLLF